MTDRVNPAVCRHTDVCTSCYHSHHAECRHAVRCPGCGGAL